jgi:hypothetical protein
MNKWQSIRLSCNQPLCWMKNQRGRGGGRGGGGQRGGNRGQTISHTNGSHCSIGVECSCQLALRDICGKES